MHCRLVVVEVAAAELLLVAVSVPARFYASASNVMEALCFWVCRLAVRLCIVPLLTPTSGSLA